MSSSLLGLLVESEAEVKKSCELIRMAGLLLGFRRGASSDW